MSKEPRENRTNSDDDVDDNPFLSIGTLLEVWEPHVQHAAPAATIAAAIKRCGVYTWDSFSNFGIADEAGEGAALKLLEAQHEWEIDSISSERVDPRSPTDYFAGDPDNPFVRYGWAKEVVPDELASFLDCVRTDPEALRIWRDRTKPKIALKRDLARWRAAIALSAEAMALKEARLTLLKKQIADLEHARDDLGEDDSALATEENADYIDKSAKPNSVGSTASAGGSTLSRVGVSMSCTGGIWTLTYQGKSSTHKDSKGLEYIELLVSKLGQPFDIAMLHQIVNPVDPESLGSELSCQTSGELEAQNLRKGGMASCEISIDERTIREVAARMRELPDLIEDARMKGDEPRILKLQDEYDVSGSYLRANVNHMGRPRSRDPIFERTRQAVQRAIKRAIGKVSEADPAIGRHLDECIETGNSCQYSPRLSYVERT